MNKTKKKKTGLREVTGRLAECICSRADWSAQGVCRLRELTGQFPEPSYSVG